MNSIHDSALTVPPQPPSCPAADWPPSRAALRRNRWLRLPLLLVSLVCGAIAGTLAAVFTQQGSSAPGEVGQVVTALAAAVFVIGASSSTCLLWAHRRRMRAMREPWQFWPARHLSHRRYEWIDLLGPDGRIASTVQLHTLWDHGGVVNSQTTGVWFAGDPENYGVISPPGGRDLLLSHPPSPRNPTPRGSGGRHSRRNS